MQQQRTPFAYAPNFHPARWSRYTRNFHWCWLFFFGLFVMLFLVAVGIEIWFILLFRLIWSLLLHFNTYSILHDQYIHWNFQYKPPFLRCIVFFFNGTIPKKAANATMQSVGWWDVSLSLNPRIFAMVFNLSEVTFI